MHSMRILVFALAALFLVAGLAGAAAALQAEPTAVAVVDVQAVFSALQERNQLEADLQSRGERLKQEAQEKEQQIRQLQQELQVLNAGSEAYQQQQDKLGQAVIQYKVWTEFEGEKLQLERALQLGQLYRRTIEAIGQVAAETGYDLVLYKEQPMQLNRDDLSIDQVRSQIAIRKVLYAGNQIDITNQVVQRMNNQYESAQ